MAEDKKKAGSPEGTQAAESTRVLWDDSNMRSVYANATNVGGGREEIVLLFGMNQAWHAAQKEIKIQLTDRVILSPFAAKRLSTLLNNVLADYESRYGKLQVEPTRPATTSVQ
jgi:hypothetical protein